MASGASILKEWLMALGFSVDTEGQRRFQQTVDKTTTSVNELATSIAAAAVAVVVNTAKIAAQFEALYYASTRTASSAENLLKFRYAARQIGLSAEEATGVIEGLSRAIRMNPGIEGLIHNLGVQTRDAQGQIRDTTDILRDLIARFRQMPFYIAAQFAEKIGIGADALLKLEQGFDKSGRAADDWGRRWGATGVNIEGLTKKSTEFWNAVNRLWDEISALGTMVADKWIEPLTKGVNEVERFIERLVELDKQTNGVSTAIIGLAAAFGVWKISAGLLSWTIGGLTGRFTALGAAATAAGAAEAKALAGGATPAVAAGGIMSFASKLVSGAFIAVLGAAALKAAGYKSYEIKPGYDTTDAPASERDATGLIKPGSKFLPWNAPTQSTKPDEGGQGKGFFGRFLDNLNPVGSAQAAPVVSGMAKSLATAAGTALGGASREAAAMAFFQRMGWTREQASGIVSNLKAENRGFDPSLKNSIGMVGIAQWDPTRQENFRKLFGHELGQGTFQEQLAFIQHELTQGTEQRAGRLLRSITGTGEVSARDAGVAVSKFYERPENADTNAAIRGSGAADIFRHTPLVDAGAASGQTNNVTVTNSFTINGASDPKTTAQDITRLQERTWGDAVRNLKGAVR